MRPLQGNTFGNFFQQYATFQSRARTRKPLLISEFGSDALDFRMDAKGEAAVNQSMQARSAAERKREGTWEQSEVQWLIEWMVLQQAEMIPT